MNTYIVSAHTATGLVHNVVVSASSKRRAIQLAEPTIQSIITARILKRTISAV